MKFGIFGLATLTLAVTGCQPEVAPPPVAAVVKAAPVLAPPAEPPPEPVFEEPRPLQLLAAELQAPGAELETSCEAPPCAHPLAAFFNALEKNAPLSPDSQTVRIVVLGNSLIATDGVVSMVRERLIERLGSAGRGQLLADRLGSWGPRIRTGTAAGKWGLSTVGILKPLKQPHGLSGAQHQALSKNASTRYSLHGDTKAEVLWFAEKPKGQLAVEIDGARVSTVDALPEGKVQRTQIDLPAESHVLKLVFPQAGPVVQGVVLEREGRGLVMDTFGVPSVDASLYLRTDEALFIEQLREREPSLVMVMLGGNEVKRLAWGRTELETIERDLKALLARIHTAVPNASCLVVSPIDSVRGPTARLPYEQRPELDGYLAIQKRIALEDHCAYFDLFGAMGGPGSLKRFRARGLVHDDLVHPRGKGLDLLGELTVSAMLRAYDSRRARAGAN